MNSPVNRSHRNLRVRPVQEFNFHFDAISGDGTVYSRPIVIPILHRARYAVPVFTIESTAGTIVYKGTSNSMPQFKIIDLVASGWNPASENELLAGIAGEKQFNFFLTGWYERTEGIGSVGVAIKNRAGQYLYLTTEESFSYVSDLTFVSASLSVFFYDELPAWRADYLEEPSGE